jgi:zinc protease
MIIKRMRFLAALSGVCAIMTAHAALPIQHWVAPSGAQVYFVENHDLPMLDLSVDFAAGSSRDIPAKAGLAGIVRHMLELGASGISETEISKRMADVGAELGGHFDLDRAGLSLRTLSNAREREAALAIMTAVLQQPDFPESVLQREKTRAIAGLKEAETQPDFIAGNAFSKALYGTHPYALPEEGEISTLEVLTRNDAVDFYRTHYTSNGATIGLIGDVTRAEAEAIAQRLTEKLPKGESPAAIPAVPLPMQAVTKEIAHPATQSHILIGYPGIKREDPDYFPLLVGNYVLGGGGFDSRLTRDVRDKRGLAYSVYSYFMPFKEAGPFELGLQTKKEQTGEALQVVRKTLRDFIQRGPTEAELKQAKNNIIGGFPLRIDSNKKILEYLSLIGFYQLPLDYLERYPRSVERVTLAQVREAFKRRIDPDKMVTVVVGGPEVAK